MVLYSRVRKLKIRASQKFGIKTRVDFRKQLAAYERIKKNQVVFSSALTRLAGNDLAFDVLTDAKNYSENIKKVRPKNKKTKIVRILISSR